MPNERDAWRTFTIKKTPGATLASLPNLAGSLLACASDQSLQFATAESCTAGALCSALTAVHGARGVLFGGFVTYDEAAKILLLDVSADLLAEATAVSNAVVQAMAMGVLARSEAGLAIAVTGVTGDSPDDRGNPRGRVHIAAAVRGGTRLHCHCEFGDLPSPVVLDATLRTAIELGIQALNWHDDGR
jgi:nicotinamide-nucleotide amidase